MNAPDMSMKVWPSEASDITVGVGTIIPQEEHSVLKDVGLFVLDAQIFVFGSEVALHKVLKPLDFVVCEYNVV